VSPAGPSPHPNHNRFASRAGFAVITASLLLSEIALTRVFSGTIGYYFAFMSISVAMLGLGAGSLYLTLRGSVALPPDVRCARASLALFACTALAMLAYLHYYPLMGKGGTVGQIAYVGLFGALFCPFFLGGVVIATVFEANQKEFGKLYAIDLIAAATGCVLAVLLLERIPAPKAMMVIAAFSGCATPLFYLGARRSKQAMGSAAAVVLLSGTLFVSLRGSTLFDAGVIRNRVLTNLVLDRWNDFSRVIIARGQFFTWGLSEIYPKRRDPQFDLMIEGVAGTQIQQFDGTHIESLDFFAYDISSLPHLLRPEGSTLVLGAGAGFDILMAKYFHKTPVVGVEVNPLVGKIVNEDFGDFSGRPYHLPGVQVHFENARTFVKRDTNTYDIVTVTWVDSGAATGAGAFALTENYLYTVEAFRDYLHRINDDGILAFMRARRSPEYDTIKGIGIAVEAMRSMGIADPSKNILVSAVTSPHFYDREMAHVMMRRKPFTATEIDVIEQARDRLHFQNLYTPDASDNDPAIERLIRDSDRAAVYASFPFDMEPNSDDRPFYFFLRAGEGRPAGDDVTVLRNSLITIFVLIAGFLVAPLIALLRRGVGAAGGLWAPTLYFSLLGLGFMLVEMKFLQQSVLIVGNPTLSLAAVLSSLLLSTGAGALIAQRIAVSPDRRRKIRYVALTLVAVLLVTLVASEPVAHILTGFPLAVRTLGLMVLLSPLGLVLGFPLPLGMSLLGDQKGLVAWCWGMNGLWSVAGSGVSIYLGIHYGLKSAFFAGMACYLLAGALLFGKLLRAPAAAPPA
jgi:hypothetical protein